MAKGKIKKRNTKHGKSTITLAGIVEKIVPAVYPGDTEKAQVTVEKAEPLYREIRVENKVRTASGEDAKLKPGAEVQVTIEADSDATINKDADT